MKRKSTYKLPHRRRREGRTDYRARLRLLKSGKPRLVIRKSSNNMSCQLVSHQTKGDQTLANVNVKKLQSLGWKAHGGSIPAAYLVGYLCGLEGKRKGVKAAVADLGVQTSTKQSRLYAALMGAVDSGLEVPHSAEVFPSKERASGKHISQYAAKLKKEQPEKYKKLFSGYLKAGLAPEEIEKHFEETRKKVK